MSNISASAFSDTKAHYDLLDGLRGVAALMVIWYHVFEGFAFASNSAIETLNHGYLAVDFFFILSGFVIGYAYDDRWGKSLTMKDLSAKLEEKGLNSQQAQMEAFYESIGAKH